MQWKSGTVNLDIGGGRFETFTSFLWEKGVWNVVYDPHNRSTKHNAVALFSVRNSVNTVTVNNVLNVIKETEARAQVIAMAAKYLRYNGTAYFCVYEGDKSGVGKATTKGWQEHRKTKDYVAEIGHWFMNVTVKDGIIIATTPLPAV